MDELQISKVIDFGLDWLTVTAVDESDSIQLFRLAESLSDTLYGDAVSRPWSAMGYKGHKCGQISVGLRGEAEAILILSGAAAEASDGYLSDILEGRVTRLDMQVTVATALEDSQYGNRLYEHLTDVARETKWGHLVTKIESPTGTTVYIGNRAGPMFIRVYDKSLDYGYPRTGSAWRYEIQYRRDHAREAARRWNDAASKRSYVFGQVMAELRRRLIDVSFRGHTLEPVIEIGTKVTTHDSRISWLTRCVAPVVTSLINAGYEEEVLHALKLKYIIERSKTNGSK
jgi:DNA relaxase NicK